MRQIRRTGPYVPTKNVINGDYVEEVSPQPSPMADKIRQRESDHTLEIYSSYSSLSPFSTSLAIFVILTEKFERPAAQWVRSKTGKDFGDCMPARMPVPRPTLASTSRVKVTKSLLQPAAASARNPHQPRQPRPPRSDGNLMSKWPALVRWGRLRVFVWV